MSNTGSQNLTSFTVLFPLPAQDKLIIKFTSQLDGTHFVFTPLQRGSTFDQGQWHVRTAPSTQFQVTVHLNSTQITVTVDDFAIDLGRLPNEPHRVYLLHGGSFRCLVTGNGSERRKLRKALAKIWPTGEPDDIEAFIATGSGFYLEGKLPALFSPQRQTSSSLEPVKISVSLRLPQPRDPFELGWLDLCKDFFPPLSPPLRYWILTSIPGMAVGEKSPNAAFYVRQFATRVAQFHLESESTNKTPTFIDEVDSSPSTGCVGFVFSTQTQTTDNGLKPLDLGWVVTGLNTRIAIGGGSAGEANYMPRYLVGRLVRASPTSKWKRDHLGFESGESRDIFLPNPLNLKPVDSSLVLKITPKALVNPVEMSLSTTSMLLLAGTVQDRPTSAAPKLSFSAWLALQSGWLEIQAGTDRARLDPSKLTEGPIRELIDLKPLARQLGIAGAASSLDMLVHTLKISRVSLLLREGDGSHAPASIELSVQNAMLTVTTTDVWLKAEAMSARQLPRLISVLDLSAITSVLGVPDKNEKGQRALETELYQLDQQLRGAFGIARFVSKNVVLMETGPIEVQIGFNEQGQPGFSFQFAPNEHLSLSYWHRPKGLPLVSTVANDHVTPNRGTPDATRGLIPYAVTGTLRVSFPGRSLPLFADKEPPCPLPQWIDESSDTWKLDMKPVDAYFLPTVPGVTMQPIANRESGVEWVYRHSPPVLDEWYTAASEASEADSPSEGKYPRDAVRFTAVEGSVAFQFQTDTNVLATGWIPPFEIEGQSLETNPVGSVFVNAHDWQKGLTEPPRAPKVELTINDGLTTLTRSIGRYTGMEGLSFPIQAKFKPRGDQLPLVQVHLVKDEGAQSTTNARIEREGQQLLTALLPENQPLQTQTLYSLDGDGRLIKEPTGSTARIGQVGNDGSLAVGDFDSATVILIKDSAVIELISIGVQKGPTQQNNPRVPLLDGLGSTWSLHNGRHSWATLAGLPLYPLNLEWIRANSMDTTGRTGELAAIWMPTKPGDQANELSRNAFDHIVLHFAHTMGQDKTKLTRIEGKIDWRFPEPEIIDRAYLMRLEATIDWSPDPDLLPGHSPGTIALSQVMLWARHPVGMLILKLDDSVKTSITNGKLTILPASLIALDNESTKDSTFSFKAAELLINPEQSLSAVPLDGFSFTWGWTPLKADGMSILISQTKDKDTVTNPTPPFWHLTITQQFAGSTATLLDVPILPHASTPDRFLFHADTSDEGKNWPDTSWFKPRAVVAILGVGFATQDSDMSPKITSLAASVLFQLQGHTQDHLADDHTNLAARLSVTAEGARVTLTGQIGLRNCMKFVYPDNTSAFEHRMIVYVDRVELPLAAVIMGQTGRDQDWELLGGALVDHELVSAGVSIITWQCAQIVRWTNLESYGKRYLNRTGGISYPNDGADWTRLALDVGVTLALSQAIEQPDISGSADIEIGDLRLGLTSSASWLREAKPVILVRLPVLGVGEFAQRVPIPPNPIHVDKSETGMVLPEGFGPQIPQRFTHEETDETTANEAFGLVQRSSLAVWLDNRRIQQMAFQGALIPKEGSPSVAFFRPGFSWPPDSHGHRLRHLLPDHLDDLGPLLADDRAVPRHYDAAMLVTPYEKGDTFPVMRHARVLDYPYVVKGLAEATMLRAMPRQTLAELIVFDHGQLAAIVTEQFDVVDASIRPECQAVPRKTANVPELPHNEETVLTAPENELLRWGSAQLQARDRRDAALVIARPPLAGSTLIQDKLIIQPIPRRFEVAARDVIDRTLWEVYPTAKTIDPRAVPPGKGAGGYRAVTRVGAPELGCLVFAAYPARKKKPIKEAEAEEETETLALPAATRFRITHLGGTSGQHTGRLRPAVIGIPGETDQTIGGVLGLTKWDAVPFTAFVSTEQYTAIPSPGERAVLRRPSVLNESELSALADEKDSLVTVIPPLCDIIASASRPGERTRTTWAFQRQRLESVDDKIDELATGSAAVVGLRRPRARAGNDQSVRLSVIKETSRMLFDGRFHFTGLELTQVVGKTDEPAPLRCEAVLTTPDRIFRSESYTESATANPALIGFRQQMTPTPGSLNNGEEAMNFDDISLYLVAHGTFRPRRERNVLMAKTVLFWSKNSVFPKLLGGNAGIPVDQIILSDVPPPSLGTAGWEQHNVTTWLLRIANQAAPTGEGSDSTAAQRLRKALEEATTETEAETTRVKKPVYLFAVIYGAKKIGDEESQWVPDNGDIPVFAIAIQPYKRSAIVHPPALTYSLITGVGDCFDDLRLAGHGTLADDDFSPIRPRPVPAPQSSAVDPIPSPVPLEWGRESLLFHLEPVRFDDMAKKNYRFDVVASGPQGEPFPTVEPPPAGETSGLVARPDPEQELQPDNLAGCLPDPLQTQS